MRTKEIGTLKAIGFSSGNVMSQFMIEVYYVELACRYSRVAIGASRSSFPVINIAPIVNLFGNSNSFRS